MIKFTFGEQSIELSGPQLLDNISSTHTIETFRTRNNSFKSLIRDYDQVPTFRGFMTLRLKCDQYKQFENMITDGYFRYEDYTGKDWMCVLTEPIRLVDDRPLAKTVDIIYRGWEYEELT